MIAGYRVSRIFKSAYFLKSGESYEVELDGEIVGEAVITAGTGVNIAQAGYPLLLSFLFEMDDEAIQLQYKFKHSYLLIKQEFWKRYKEQLESSSPLWGGFSTRKQSVGKTSYHAGKLVADAGYRFDTSFHKNAVTASLNATNPRSRFLSLYHILELSFDWHTVVRIRNLGKDLKGIGKILNDRHGNEIDLIKGIFKSRCRARPKIESLLNDVILSNEVVRAATIFEDFGKQEKLPF